ncbi:hypothetical protein C8Q73DRAFT_661408, partial [Cubamyces lactineus]
KVREWLPLRQEYLDELLRRCGRRAESFDICAECKTSGSCYRCLDCRRPRPLCSACILINHRDAPLHRPEFWNGSYFEPAELSALGLVVELGHDGNQCPDPSPLADILVYHVNGYHKVRVSTCTCTKTHSEPLPAWQQFLRADWFPATTTRPSTAFTFDVLDLFHHLTHQSKANAYDFFHTLHRRTSNAGSCQHPFAHVARLWRHLQQLKWAGRGQDPSGVAATPPGSVTVICPACPQPGKNLPEGWELSPPEKMWLYTLYLMMDANFRCRCKDRGLDDVNMAPGWSYYVEQSRFHEHVARACDREENTCSAEHNAIIKANMRKEGYVASGIGAVLCARHAFFRPNGVGDLHLGEKYVTVTPFPYMDYLVVSTLLGSLMYMLVLSYDVACQYHKNFEKRLREDFVPDMHLDLDDVKVRFVIPKNHISVHGRNHSQYSLNLVPHVGRTYGEGVESSWSHLNPAAMSTREMALATRHEILNDHMSAWNWRKKIELGPFLLRSLRQAAQIAHKQRRLFNEFTATFPPDVVKEWERVIALWNVNPGHGADPYEEPETTTTISKVRLELAKEEAADAAVNPEVLDMSPSVFIQVGLDLEDQQYVLFLHCPLHAHFRFRRSLKLRDAGKTEGELADHLERRNTLARRIRCWAEAQDVYMPAVIQLRVQTNTLLSPSGVDTQGVPPTATNTDTESDGPPIPNPEDASLFLPSALPPHLLVGEHTSRLLNYERRLRLAQLEDSLADIRRLRRILKGISEFKRLNVSGTGNKPNTRVRALYAKFLRKQVRLVARYRAAYCALAKIDADGNWRRTFRELLDSHLTGPGRDDDDVGEGHVEISWIWLAPCSAFSDSDESREYNDSMRAEWARSKARAERWEEEVELLVEEMDRVVKFLEAEASQWRLRADRRVHIFSNPRLPFDIADGVRAFALRQVDIYSALARRFACQWTPLLRTLGRPVKWVEAYYTTAGASTSADGEGLGEDADGSDADEDD